MRAAHELAVLAPARVRPRQRLGFAARVAHPVAIDEPRNAVDDRIDKECHGPDRLVERRGQDESDAQAGQRGALEARRGLAAQVLVAGGGQRDVAQDRGHGGRGRGPLQDPGQRDDHEEEERGPQQVRGEGGDGHGDGAEGGPELHDAVVADAVGQEAERRREDELGEVEGGRDKPDREGRHAAVGVVRQTAQEEAQQGARQAGAEAQREGAEQHGQQGAIHGGRVPGHAVAMLTAMTEQRSDAAPFSPPDAPAQPPAAIAALARQRADARTARDYTTADRLRAEIEASGWKVVDRGTDFSLEPAHPPDLADGGRLRYGASLSVPSRLDEPATAPATIILVATDWPDDLARALAGLQAHVPPVTQLVIVADDPSADQAAALEPFEAAGTEVVWTSARLGTAAAIDCGLRRASGTIVILFDTSLEPTGDLVTPLVAALADPTVAVVGGWGIVSDDLRTFREAPPGDVDAIEGYCQAFRRADVVDRGPLDERFRFYRNLDIWWSLVLRDEGHDQPPRRAVRTETLPLDPPRAPRLRERAGR